MTVSPGEAFLMGIALVRWRVAIRSIDGDPVTSSGDTVGEGRRARMTRR